MIKVTLLLASLLALSAAAVLRADSEPVACPYPDEIWGSEDGTKFNFCLPNTDTVITRDCPTNTFFVRNATVCGCLPLTAVSPSCVNTIQETPQPCTGAHLLQPQPSTEMDKFYLCPEEGAEPVLLTCPNGMAYVDMDHYLGCFPWVQWRTIHHCAQ